MKPVNQTKQGKENGNCFAACVASILERPIDDVGIDRTQLSLLGMPSLLKAIEEKANCKIYYASYASIVDGYFKTSEKHCIVSVCSSVGQNDDPQHPTSHWHGVVCEIGSDGKLTLVFNPTNDARKSLQSFKAIKDVYFVKPL